MDRYGQLLSPDEMHRLKVSMGIRSPANGISRPVEPGQSVQARRLAPGYGYVRIRAFRADTARAVETALTDLAADNRTLTGNRPMKGLILDLRDNRGGVLEQAAAVADLFIEDGELVHVKGRTPPNSFR